MNFSKEDLLIGTLISLTSAVVAAGATYYYKTKHPAPTSRSVKSDAFYKGTVELNAVEKKALKTFNDLYISTPTEIPFNENWHSRGGYMDGVVRAELAPGVYRSKDAYDRRIIINVAYKGVVSAVYQRYAGEMSPIESIGVEGGIGAESDVVVEHFTDTILKAQKAKDVVSEQHHAKSANKSSAA